MKEHAITANEMKAIDVNCHYLGLSPAILMENAGAAIAREAERLISGGHSDDKDGSGSLLTGPSMSDASFGVALSAVPSHLSGRIHHILLFAGGGNNGGDAFVAARHLSARAACRFSPALQPSVPGLKISVVCPSPDAIRTPEARLHFDLLAACPVFVRTFQDGSPEDIADLLSDADLIVDGLLGAGLKGPPRKQEQKIIDMIRAARLADPSKKVVSIDIPSGMAPDGSPGSADPVLADVTVTFHKMKTYLNTESARKNAGKIVVSGIGVLPDAEKYAGPGDVRLLYSRGSADHKGNAGKVLIIGGGPYTGAPYLSGMAALRSGADIVTVLVPSAIKPVVSGYAPDLIVCGLPSECDHLCPEDTAFIEPYLRSHDTVIIGPGLGPHPETMDAVSRLLPLCRKAVIDADALQPDFFTSPVSSLQMILTPHSGEFARLSRKSGAASPVASSDVSSAASSDASFEAVAEAVRFLARETGVTILKKGPIDIISDGVRLRCNRTGNAGMNVGGTGDVLSGIIGSLFARNAPFESALCGAYICGRAGDLAAAEKGRIFTATDVLSKIPEVFRDL